MKFRIVASAVVLVLRSTGLSPSLILRLRKAPPIAKGTKLRKSIRSAHSISSLKRIKTNLVRSAEKMPEESYNFRPTDAVRSYSQIIGHLADAQYGFCSIALGEKTRA